MYMSSSGPRLSKVCKASGDSCHAHHALEGYWINWFHDGCWSLLMKHFGHGDIDLGLLYDLCSDTPEMKLGSLRGELASNFRLSPTVHAGLTVAVEKGGRHIVPNGAVQKPQIQSLRQSARSIPRPKKCLTRLEICPAPTGDCFSLLAVEIRLEIATYLSTADFFNSRLSSRAMAAIWDVKSFWKSRFSVNGERGYLSYLLETPSRWKDWRLSYHATARSARFSQFRYLQDVWRVNRWLKDRYAMARAPDTQIASQGHLLSALSWQTINVDFRGDQVHKNERETGGTERVPLIQAVPLPSSVISLAVSVLREECSTSITGLDILSADMNNPRTIFGYRIPGEQVLIDLQHRRLEGFSLIFDHDGIHALRPLFESDEDQSWIGQPSHIGYCQLRIKKGVTALSGKFDVS